MAQSRHARNLTQEEWLAEAMSDSRQAYYRASDALAIDVTFGDGPGARAQQARADSLTLSDLVEAETLAADASRRSKHLDAAAAHFHDAATVTALHHAARQLQDAADLLRARAAAFKAPIEALAAEDGGEDGDGLFVDVTEEQAHVLETRMPVLIEQRRVVGSGAAYLTLSDKDMQTVYEMYADWRWTQQRIASLLGCSSRKLRELLDTHGLKRPKPDVPRIVEVIRGNMSAGNADVGIVRTIGELEDKKVPYTWSTVAELLRTEDAVGRDLRFRRKIPRVRYNIREVNGMWHFDGYEHLAPWKIWIHGAIDGASRYVVSMNAVDNKQPETVAAFFMKRVAELGVPHKVRADKGTENVAVRDFVALLREAGYKIRYIEGPSVHNQRIERWWGDLCPYIVPIATALDNFTREGGLDVENPLHREALHFFMLPFVNRVIDKVLGAWHHHRVSSPGMKCTPHHKCWYMAMFRVWMWLNAPQNRRRGRFQELAVEFGSFRVAACPATVAARAAAAARAGAPPPAVDFAPSAGLREIDDLSCMVLRNQQSVEAARARVHSPGPWYTTAIRAAVERFVPPVVPGDVLHDVLPHRFQLALGCLQSLAARVQLGHPVSVDDVRAYALLYQIHI